MESEEDKLNEIETKIDMPLNGYAIKIGTSINPFVVNRDERS